MVREINEYATKLFSKPGNERPQEFERQQAQYEDLSGDFKDKLVDFSKQFCYIYTVRLAELREILIPRVAAKWGKLNEDFYPQISPFQKLLRILL